jgi:hypothetical protein
VQLECPVVSNPIAFTGPDGKQRIAVYSGSATCPATPGGGGNAVAPGGRNLASKAADIAVPMHPSLKALYDSVPAMRFINKAVTSGYVHVFKLP